MRLVSATILCSCVLFSAGCNDTDDRKVVVNNDLSSTDVAPADQQTASDLSSFDLASLDLRSIDQAVTPADLSSTAPLTASVTVNDNFFSPANVTIAAGGKVTWSWTTAASHSVTSGSGTPSGLFDSGVKIGGMFEFTLPTVGTFSYYCTVHGFTAMHGTVTVQ